MQQIVVVKGWEGFADRLQTLSHCLQYCIKNKAAICVDWRDYMWGQETRDFHDYFKIKGVETVSLKTVLERVKNSAKITPSAYNYKLIQLPPCELIHFTDFDMSFSKDYDKIDSDIIVSNSKGTRVWHLDNLIRNIEIVDSLKSVIIQNLKSLIMPFTLVHLRGTDRLTTNQSAIDSAKEKYKELLEHSKVRVYLVSDSKVLVDMWLKDFPETCQIQKDAAVLKLPYSLKATHMLSQEVLEYYDVDKDTLNINTIQDFITFTYASWSVGHSSSYFTTMAQFLSKGGACGIGQWLGGYQPQRMSLKNPHSVNPFDYNGIA